MRSADAALWTPELARAMAWYFRCLLAVGCTRLRAWASAARELSDEDVLSSLRSSLRAWGDSIHSNNFSYCKQLYEEDASLLAELGPAAKAMLERAGLENPSLRRGRAAIEDFWRSFARGVFGGLNNLRVFEDEGPYARAELVVDDDTVILAGQFALPELKGRILSSTWARSGQGWHIRSDMVQVEYSALPITVDHSNSAAEVTNEKDTVTTSTVDHGSGRRYYYHGPKPNMTGLETLEDEAEGAGGALLWMVAALAVAFGIFYLFRAHRRRAAMRTIGGPDTLLG